MARRPVRLPRGVPAPASVAPEEAARKSRPFMSLVQQPVATHAAEELAGLERLRRLIVQSGRGRVHARQHSPPPRHQRSTSYCVTDAAGTLSLHLLPVAM